MSLSLDDSLVDVVWLHQHLQDPDLIIFDASWHMPAAARNGLAEWRQQRIPGARYFDFDGRICQPDSPLPHMMPDESRFSDEVRLLGLNHDSAVVIYDSLGLFSSPRVWWMLRSMGFENCAILDGGLPAWLAAGYATDDADVVESFANGDFVARFDARLFSDAKAVLAALDDRTSLVLDARPGVRFRGEVAEPREGLRMGHMPGSLNLPFSDLCVDGRLKTKAELQAIFSNLPFSGDRVIFSCGSGITACVIAFAAHHIGYENLSVYDGSWCEWGLPGELPVVKG
ncbi:MAG: thiosulfate/3-mercaptopyruvate sulfurtransferase [Planctomycetota bacterium]|jgi:thiosulfate/3-mercaptopyruvate sulfurtransferase